MVQISATWYTQGMSMYEPAKNGSGRWVAFLCCFPKTVSVNGCQCLYLPERCWVMYVPQNGKIAQESYPPARAILRGFIPWHTLYVPSGWFLYHSIVLSWYSRVQVSTNGVHQGNVSCRNGWTDMNHVQTINRINMSVPCTDGYGQCAYNDERVYTNWNTDFIVQTR